MDNTYNRDNWGGGNNFQLNNNFSNGSNFGNQQRWQETRGGFFQQRARANGAGLLERSGIDAELLHQTVHAVVVAVTAATKVPNSTLFPTNADAMAGGTWQQVGVSVAVSNATP
jgi:hypothetical protein